MRCPACGHSNASSQRFCGGCGAPLVASDAETVASPTPARFAGDATRFVPGQILGDRYRMVGLLGRGGMGEVYRADDLKLGQPVALKFLPRDVEADPDRLERFLTEVRLSLRVTHPNVCRVFDIGQIDGRHFLSMEFVDGEDLASLLRRIGRLPEDKAVEVARQLCAGLAAAHDEGVLHRDLKPANIMIDGRGRAKITDFGLAGATAGIVGREAQAGTPQYMAPEQFDGRELSVRTDLYSLGLVLYELFTGKRAFDRRNVTELAQLQSSTPTSPSAHVAGLSPIVERAILRCVDPDPAKRPASAASLAAALPGGDPVARAIAAGETPSPEMVARSGGGGELRPAIAIACLLIVLLGIGAVWFGLSRTTLANRIPMPKPPAELRGAARAALSAAGYATAPGGSAQGFLADYSYLDQVEKDDQSSTRWRSLGTVQPVPLWFWYRESATPLTPFESYGEVDYYNPPLDVPAMTRVRLDPSGRLQALRVVSPDLPEKPGPWSEPDWAPLFLAAGFTQGEWTPAEPLWAPPGASDVRRAWTTGTLRIEAASFRGRPVWFAVMPPWRQPDEAPPSAIVTSQRVIDLITTAVVMLVIGGAIVLARRNLRQGRSDRRGALRFAVVYAGLGAAFELTRLSGGIEHWLDVFTSNLARQLYFGLLVWLFYVAVEPYVRRLWPGTLVAWNRVLEGRFRDAMVGRHILLGAVAGMGFTLLFALPMILAALTGLPMPRPAPIVAAPDSIREFLQTIFGVVQNSFRIPVSLLVTVLLFRVIFVRPWLAYLVMFVLAGAVSVAGLGFTLPALTLPLTLALILIVLTRLGLLAFLFAIIFSSWTGLPLITDTSSWSFPHAVVTMALFAGLSVYGFWMSLGDQKLFQDSILERQA